MPKKINNLNPLKLFTFFIVRALWVEKAFSV